MRKLLIAGLFFLIIASDWAWTKSKTSAPDSFVPRSFSAIFVQEYESKLRKGKTKKSDGTIDYQFPGNVRLEIKGNSELIFVSNAEKTWLFTPSAIEGEPSQLRIGTTNDYNIANFFDMLKNGLKSNRDYTVKKQGDEYEITFSKEAGKKVDLAKATLVFKKDKNAFEFLEKIKLIHQNNKKVSMTFSKISTNANFGNKHFQFTAPKNTRIAN